MFMSNMSHVLHAHLLAPCLTLAFIYLFYLTPCHPVTPVTLTLLFTQSLPEDAVPPLPSNPHLLVPPSPILKADNWPLLTVSKGFFEILAAKGAAAAAAAAGGNAGVGAGMPAAVCVVEEEQQLGYVLLP